MIELISDTNITLMIPEGSISKAICQLSFIYPDIYGFKPEDKVFYFNRIKVEPKYEGQGLGAEMMKRMVEICDQQGIIVVCDVNPYGSLDHDQLVKWYKSYDFKDYSHKEYQGLVRYPNAQV